MSKTSTVATTGVSSCCVGQILYLVLGGLVGGFFTRYDVWALTGKECPWLIAILVSIPASAITVPAAIVIWLLNACGIIHVPQHYFQ